MRLRDFAAGLGFLVLLVAIGVGSARLGGVFGRPDPVGPSAAADFLRAEPPVAGGLYGFETLGRLLALGPWGTITAIEEITVSVGAGGEGFAITIERDGFETTIEIPEDSPGRVRQLSAADLQVGDAVAVRETGAGVGILVTR